MVGEVLSMLGKAYFLGVLERLVSLVLGDSVLGLVWFNCY